MLRRVPRPLLLLQLVALIQVLAWSFALPPLQGPDEVWHVAYVQHLAETGDAPGRNDGTRPVSTEQGLLMNDLDLSPAVGVATALPARTRLDRSLWERAQAPLGDAARSDGNGPNPIAQNPPLYYLWEAGAYLAAERLDLIDRLFAMKLANALLYLATICFVWLLAGEVFRRRDLQTLATAVVVLLPQLAWLSGHVNPDTLLVTIWTAFFWLAARVLRCGGAAPELAAMGAAAGAAALTHGRGLALAVPAAVVLGIALWRRRDRATLVGVGAAVLLAGAAVVAAAAWTASSGGAAFGGEVAKSGGAVSVGGFLSYVWQFYAPRLWFMDPAPGPDYGFREVFVEGFFGTFASLEVRYADWIYDVLQVAWVAGLIGVVVVLVRTRAGADLVAALAAGALALLFLLHRVAYEHLQDGAGDPIIQGRYILPLAGIFALAVALLASSLRPAHARAFGATVIVAAALLQLAGLGLTFARFYA